MTICPERNVVNRQFCSGSVFDRGLLTLIGTDDIVTLLPEYPAAVSSGGKKHG